MTTIGVDLAPMGTLGDYQTKMSELINLTNQLVSQNDSEWASRPFYLCDVEDDEVPGGVLELLTVAAFAPIALHSKVILWWFPDMVYIDEWLTKLRLLVEFVNENVYQSTWVKGGYSPQKFYPLLDLLIVVAPKPTIWVSDEHLHDAIFTEESHPTSVQRDSDRRQIHRSFRSIKTVCLPLLSYQSDTGLPNFEGIPQPPNRDLAEKTSKLVNWILEESRAPRYLGELRLTTGNFLSSLQYTIESITGRWQKTLEKTNDLTSQKHMKETTAIIIRTCKESLKVELLNSNFTHEDFDNVVNKTIEICTAPFSNYIQLNKSNFHFIWCQISEWAENEVRRLNPLFRVRGHPLSQNILTNAELCIDQRVRKLYDRDIGECLRDSLASMSPLQQTVLAGNDTELQSSLTSYLQSEIIWPSFHFRKH